LFFPYITIVSETKVQFLPKNIAIIFVCTKNILFSTLISKNITVKHSP